jgi:hypothetical protein
VYETQPTARSSRPLGHHGRTVSRADFETAAALLGGVDRGSAVEASRNSRYVEAILLDVRHKR